MTATNYFKSNGVFFPFIDNVRTSADTAYKAASAVGVPCIYRPTPVPGPWDAVAVIGHRPRAAIFADIANTQNDDAELDRLHGELGALHEVFLASGRVIPLSAVA